MAALASSTSKDESSVSKPGAVAVASRVGGKSPDATAASEESSRPSVSSNDPARAKIRMAPAVDPSSVASRSSSPVAAGATAATSSVARADTSEEGQQNGGASAAGATSSSSKQGDKDDIIAFLHSDSDRVQRPGAHFGVGVPEEDVESGTIVEAEVAPDIEAVIEGAIQKAVQKTLAATQRQNQENEEIAATVACAEHTNPEEQEGDDEKEDKICGLPKKSILMIFGCGLLLLVVAAVGAAVGIMARKDNDEGPGSREKPIETPDLTQPPVTPTDPPSEAPAVTPTSSPTRSSLGPYGDILMPGVDLSLVDQTSPQYLAVEWIAEIDPRELSAARSTELLERYSLAVLYFATQGEYWLFNFGWLAGADHCEWAYVECNLDNRVTGLTMTFNTIGGTLPTEIGNFLSLEHMWFGRNYLSGTIPSEVGRLMGLTSLQIWENSLSGSLPSEIGLLSLLAAMGLSTNNLIGELPSELGNLTVLQSLQLNTNIFEGLIPTSLGSLTGLGNLGLTLNLFWGAIPSELGRLTLLTTFQLWENAFSGEIPSEFSAMTSLTGLGMSTNALSGAVPSQLGDLSNLRYLSLFENDLTSTIPSQLGRLYMLVDLVISNNGLTGTIPTDLGLLSSLFELLLFNNELIGTVPTELGRLTQCTYLGISHNNLVGSIPSELRHLTNMQEAYFFGNSFDAGLETLFCGLGLDNFYADCIGTPADLTCACCSAYIVSLVLCQVFCVLLEFTPECCASSFSSLLQNWARGLRDGCSISNSTDASSIYISYISANTLKIGPSCGYPAP
jgi:Leucine-rich repeat (LRR) protein